MTAACSHRRAVLTRNSSVVLSGSASSKVRIRRHSSAPGKIRGRHTRRLDDGRVRCAIRRLRAAHSPARSRSRAALPDPPPHAGGALHACSPPMQSPPAKGMPQPRRQPQQRETPCGASGTPSGRGVPYPLRFATYPSAHPWRPSMRKLLCNQSGFRPSAHLTTLPDVRMWSGQRFLSSSEMSGSARPGRPCRVHAVAIG